MKTKIKMGSGNDIPQPIFAAEEGWLDLHPNNPNSSYTFIAMNRSAPNDGHVEIALQHII
ncbi:hypothetical protein LQV63_23900 [Paenibacillus profundus]|uniref:Uncharacterized protein n=1 Tax=Paenibacillus profundus TaxID=1173085 RepID=A0ABS8YKB7_9BACL|nr:MULTISPECIES: hypothetical protein [Paenibacillus]MCE5172325.1 hypothetical protein [Paenibacillus profundus]